MPTLVLLPGLHGTDDLWPLFLAAVPVEISRRIVAYPTDRPLDYDALLNHLERELRDETDMVIVGESFSGPLAIRFGAIHRERVRTVILSASFAASPYPSWLRWICVPSLFKMPLPAFAIRWAVAGRGASKDVVDQIRSAIRRPNPAVLAHRARCILMADETHRLRDCRNIVCLVPNQDHMVWPRNVRTIFENRPDATVVQLEGPHLILQASPHAAWDAIRPYVEGFV